MPVEECRDNIHSKITVSSTTTSGDDFIENSVDSSLPLGQEEITNNYNTRIYDSLGLHHHSMRNSMKNGSVNALTSMVCASFCHRGK